MTEPQESSFWQLRLIDMRDAVVSSEPTPGGGSVAIICGVLGASLIVKGLAVSIRRTQEKPERSRELAGTMSGIQNFCNHLSRYADSDARSFQAYLNARGKSRATDYEAQVRAIAMKDALISAIRIPLEAAEDMCQCLALTASAVKLAIPAVLSDIIAGSVLLEASVRSVLLNVDINLRSLDDATLEKELFADRARIEKIAGGHIAFITNDFSG